MTSSRHDAPVRSRPVDRTDFYTFHVGVVLEPAWAAWFEGGEVLRGNDGTTRIVIRVRDQAMLFGLLIRIRDLGVPLLGLYPGRPPGP